MAELEKKDSDVPREELYLIKEHLKLLSEKIDNAKAQSGAEKSEKGKAWWTTVVELLGIPAVVVAILVQVNQISDSKGTPEKTFAETEKVKIESLKTRAELEGILNDLAEKKQAGVAAYKAQIEETLPKLESTLQRLHDIEQKSHESTLQRILSVYVSMWIVYAALSLFFEILGHIWAALLNSLSNTLYTLNDYDPDKPRNPTREKRIRKLQRLIPWIHSLFGPLPSIIHWAIRVSIFVAILIPFFDQISHLLGSNETFGSLTAAAKQGDVPSVIARLKELLLGSGI